MGELTCRRCGQDSLQASRRGAYLERVNEKGVPGIWQCSPSCEHHHGDQEDALDAALDPDEH